MKLDCTQSILQKRNSISCTIDKAALWTVGGVEGEKWIPQKYKIRQSTSF